MATQFDKETYIINTNMTSILIQPEARIIPMLIHTIGIDHKVGEHIKGLIGKSAHHRP